jgi:hypothetical protein
LDLEALYTPGRKHVIPLANPDVHLTGPCWRDFSRHVRSFDHWDVKRVAATEEQRAEYREQHRKGAVYFIHALYTVPGLAKKKRAKKRKTLDCAGDAKPPAKKQATNGDAACAVGYNAEENQPEI